MPFLEHSFVSGVIPWKGAKCDMRRLEIPFVSEVDGGVGIVEIGFSGELVAVGTSAAFTVEVKDEENIKLLGAAGVDLDGRYNWPVPQPIVGKLFVEISDAPVSDANKVVLYVR